MKQITEKLIEDYLVKEIKGLKGKTYKFISPGNIGVPDRMVLLPNGRIFFVELKSPKGKPTAIQIRQIETIKSFGQRVFIANSFEAIDEIIKKAIQENYE